MINSHLKNIIGKKVKRLFLIVWPPYGEEDEKQIDISIGFIFEHNNDEIFKVTTDKNDLTQPSIELLPIPESIFSWNSFEKRMKDWMGCNDELDFGFEYYKLTNVETFKDIVGHRIMNIQLIGADKENIFALKLIFENDYIISSPIIDGNTIETRLFNKYDNLKIFNSLGEIKYFSISEL